MWAKKSKVAEKRRERTPLRSSFVRIAQRLGLITDEDARKADELIAHDLEHSSQDIVIEHGILDMAAVKQIDEARKTEDVIGHLDDQHKRAMSALDALHTTEMRLQEVVTRPVRLSDVLAAKKKSGQ